MKIIECQQGSQAWFNARCGVVTASEIDALVTPNWKIKDGKGPESYLHKKVAEKIVGYSAESLSSWAMDQGKLNESVALPWYEFTFDTPVQRVGFCLSDNGRFGCSPDGLIANDRGIEIKSPQPEAQVRHLLGGKVPEDYLPQIHFSMFVTGRPLWEFVSYSRILPTLHLVVEKDEKIQTLLWEAVSRFLEKMDAALARIESLQQVDRATTRATAGAA